MVYAYDRNIQMPTKDLYDTQIMAMAVSAAKDMYDNARQEIKDFNKQYGDFITPIAKDQEWYDKNITGMFQRELDNMYAQGIDPLRSVEGRSRIFKLANSIPTGIVNTMKANAALYEKRLAEQSKLGDKYDRSMDITLYGDPTQFSTVGPNGEINTFNYAPPSAYQTIDELIEPVIKNIKPIYDEAYTKQKNDGNDWYTITKDRMMDAVDDSMSDILATPSGRFQYILSQREAEAIGRPELATQILRDKIKNRLSDHEYIEPKVNPFALDDYRTANDIKAHRQKAAITAYYSRHGDDNGTEAPYSIKTRMFNEGLANLLGINVDVIDDVAKNGKFVYNRAVETQTALASEYQTSNGLVSALSQQTPYSRQQIIDVLDLKQVSDDDKQNNIYTMDKHELKNIVDASYIASRIKTSDPLDTGTVDQSTKAIRNKYKNTYRSDMKVDPTGNIVTYLDKNGTIKKYAELEIVGGGSGAGEIVYIDLGNNSTKVDGSDAPVGMDYTQSTLRDYNYEAIDNKRASNQTKTIVTSYNR